MSMSGAASQMSQRGRRRLGGLAAIGYDFAPLVDQERIAMTVPILRYVSALLLAIAALTADAAAQSYPQRVVRIVNPFPPGGSVDTMARILAQKLSESLGAQVIVDNRAGAGGN